MYEDKLPVRYRKKGEAVIHNHFYQLRQFWIGIILALLTLFYGIGLGVAFGVAEDGLKGTMKASAQEVFNVVYKGDKAEMSKITDKSWVYFKRAHIHANGMGTASLLLIVLLSLMKRHRLLKKITAIGLGAGSLGYSLFWMFAGMRAPGLGSTGLAKESLAWLALPSVGIFVSGVIAVIVVFVWGILTPSDIAVGDEVAQISS